MRKRRCPVCKKLKRFAEGGVCEASEPKPWRVIGHVKMCHVCADRAEKDAAERQK